MKQLIRAVAVNSRDLRTGLLVVIDDCQYIFNAPDGLQRAMLSQKQNFNKTRYVFLSSLSPDHFGGFPGLYLSAREQVGAQNLGTKFAMTVIGPEGLRDRLLHAFAFMGKMKFLRPLELSSNEANKDQQFFGPFGLISTLKQEEEKQ